MYLFKYKKKHNYKPKFVISQRVFKSYTLCLKREYYQFQGRQATYKHHPSFFVTIRKDKLVTVIYIILNFRTNRKFKKGTFNEI